MKFNHLVAPLLLFAFILAGCEDQQAQISRTCVIDLTRLMRDSSPGKQGVQALQELQNQFEQELTALQEKVEKNPQDAQAVQQLQQIYTEAQQKIQTEGQNIANQIYDLVQREIDSFRAANNYSYILLNEGVASYAPDMDKTSEILDRLNGQKIEFKIGRGTVSQGSPTQTQSAPDSPTEKNETGTTQNPG